MTFRGSHGRSESQWNGVNAVSDSQNGVNGQNQNGQNSNPKQHLFSTQREHINSNQRSISRRFQFISPLFIVEEWNESPNDNDYVIAEGGYFYSLSLNLEAIVMSWGPSRQIALVHFLLRRETADSKAMMMKMLGDMIRSYICGDVLDLRSRLDFISEYFIVLNEVLRRAVEESAAIGMGHG